MGGRLYERYSEGQNLIYPHGFAPVQTLAFMQDGAGLQFTTLDGKSQGKSFNTRGLDMKIRFLPFGRTIPLTVTLPPRSVKAIP
jgi:hypothetical protein